MKTKITSLFIVLLMITSSFLSAQNTVIVTATGNDISDNLNLEAIATLFGESKNLQQFEHYLNEPRYKISNLDLNHDGYVDYIRVVEHHENNEYVITLQDIIGNDLYQDIATIDVGRNNLGQVNVQIIGNPYFYGSNYIIEPIYTRRPLIYGYFWNPYYSLWHSPYYWNRYPRYYRPWRVYSAYQYHRNIHRFIRPAYFYRYPSYNRYRHLSFYYNRFKRNDYERHHPDLSFQHKYSGVKNHYELNNRRNSSNHYVPSNRVVNRRSNNYNRSSNANKYKRTGNNSPINRRVIRSNHSVNKNITRRSPSTVLIPSKSYRPRSSSSTVRRSSPGSTRYRSVYKRSDNRTNRSTVKRSRPTNNSKSRVIRTKPVKKESQKKRDNR